MAQAAALSFLLLLAIYAASVVLGETRQQKFKIRRIVKSKWTATETSNRGEYNNVAMCSQYCLLRGEDCDAFHHKEDADKCEIGHLSDKAILDAEGIEVFVKPENATIYPHVMLNDWFGNFIDINLKDMTTEYPTFLNLDTAGLPKPSGGQWHKNGFLFCSFATDLTCKHYSMTTGIWTDKGNLPHPHLHEPGMVAILDEIWFVGGGYIGGTKKVSYLKGWTWRQASDYPLSVYHMAATAISRTEFMVCGGYTLQSHHHKECYKMDALKKDAWIPLASMPVGRVQFNLAAYKDGATGKTKVMAATGYNGKYLNRVDIYDVQINSWETARNFPFRVYANGLFTHDNVVWHVGGTDSANARSRKVFRYNADDDRWTDVGMDLPADAHNVWAIKYNEVGH